MSKGRYLVGQKLSDYQIEKIIRAYAAGVLANDLVAESRRSRSPRSPNTIFEIYHLVRSRLFEVGLYPRIEDFRDAMEDPEYSVIFPYTDKARRLAEMENRIQGVTQRTVPAHFGEWLYRAKNPDITPDGFFLDIKRIIKLTGHLTGHCGIRPQAWS